MVDLAVGAGSKLPGFEYHLQADNPTVVAMALVARTEVMEGRFPLLSQKTS